MAIFAHCGRKATATLRRFSNSNPLKCSDLLLMVVVVAIAGITVVWN